MDLISEMDALNFELECAIDNLWAVHGNMEADKGANWRNSNNAVFSVFMRLYSIKKEMRAAIDAAVEQQKNEGDKFGKVPR